MRKHLRDLEQTSIVTKLPTVITTPHIIRLVRLELELLKSFEVVHIEIGPREKIIYIPIPPLVPFVVAVVVSVAAGAEEDVSGGFVAGFDVPHALRFGGGEEAPVVVPDGGDEAARFAFSRVLDLGSPIQSKQE